MPAPIAPRIAVVSADAVLAQRLGSSLTGLALTVDLRRTLDADGVQPALCVVDLVGDPAELANIRCPVIVVLREASVATVVEVMQTSQHVAGCVVNGEFGATTLRRMVARIVADDVFGLDKVMAPGTHVHTSSVGDYDQKAACMAALAAYVEGRGLPRSYQQPIEQCIDEMIMNALYDAPVDASGKHVFEGMAIRQRIRMRTAQQVIVQYASDDQQLAVSVRDAFGSLQRSTVIRHLYKAVHARDAVDRGAGGAGLGIYLMASSSTAVYFNVLNGIATEAICCFELNTPKRELAQFGFFTQRDARGQPPTPPARRMYAKPRYQLGATVAAIAAALVAGVIVVPRLLAARETAEVAFTTIPRGATVELDGRLAGIAFDRTLVVAGLEPGRSYRVIAQLEGYEPRPTTLTPRAGANSLVLELRALPRVELDSQPPGATVEVDGAAMGTTPLVLTSLAPGTSVSFAFKRPGYVTATQRLEVPGVGEVKRFAQPLQRSPDFVRVRLASIPAGAEILQLGQAPTVDRTYAPADVFLEIGKPHRFVLTMRRHVPALIELVPARTDEASERTATLAGGATLRIEAPRGGKITVVGTPHCADVAPPVECTLAPGTYTVEYVASGSAKITRDVEVSADATERFE
jgi:CBS domain-containing protein